jgi:hypothetical protein
MQFEDRQNDLETQMLFAAAEEAYLEYRMTPEGRAILKALGVKW